MEYDFLQTITLAFVAISSFAAAVSATMSFLESRNSRLANSALLFVTLRERFATKEMNDSLLLLYEARKDGGTDFFDDWYAEFQVKTARSVTLNDARRMVNTYVADVVTALKSKALTKYFAKRAITVSCFEIYKEVCIPMHDKIYGSRRPTNSDSLMTIEQLFSISELRFSDKPIPVFGIKSNTAEKEPSEAGALQLTPDSNFP